MAQDRKLEGMVYSKESLVRALEPLQPILLHNPLHLMVQSSLIKLEVVPTVKLKLGKMVVMQ